MGWKQWVRAAKKKKPKDCCSDLEARVAALEALTAGLTAEELHELMEHLRLKRSSSLQEFGDGLQP